MWAPWPAPSRIWGGCWVSSRAAVQADPYSSTSTGPRLRRNRGIGAGVCASGFPTDGCAEGSSPGVDPALSGCARQAWSSLGCTIEPVPFPHAELAGIIAWVITVVEFAAHHAGNLHRIGEFTPSAACRLAAGARTSAADYLKALRARQLGPARPRRRVRAGGRPGHRGHAHLGARPGHLLRRRRPAVARQGGPQLPAIQRHRQSRARGTRRTRRGQTGRRPDRRPPPPRRPVPKGRHSPPDGNAVPHSLILAVYFHDLCCIESMFGIV